MDFIKRIFLTFAMVLTGITICSAFFVTVFFPGVEFVIVLWEIIAMSAASALGNLIFYSRRVIGRKQMLIRNIIHLIYIVIIVLGGAFLWGWITPGRIGQLVVMILLILITYSVVMYVNVKMENKTAEEINKKLSKLNKEEEQ